MTKSWCRITGAGPIAIDALRDVSEMPSVIASALEEICMAAQAKGSRLWMDAEQQIFQPGIDKWTLNLMRKYNNGGNIMIYNTIQAYLKESEANLNRHIRLAAEEGWGLGIKLVRGAYIDYEIRSLIHDTKEDTDKAYDLCADAMISCRLPRECEHLQFPNAALFLASHNATSIEKAVSLHRSRSSARLQTIKLDCGQIYGMADELSCKLIKAYENCLNGTSYTDASPPKVFKYAAWGTLRECMGYLTRRAIENRGAVERTGHMIESLGRELRRRLWG